VDGSSGGLRSLRRVFRGEERKGKAGWSGEQKFVQTCTRSQRQARHAVDKRGISKDWLFIGGKLKVKEES